jgi:hypothetical protein
MSEVEEKTDMATEGEEGKKSDGERKERDGKLKIRKD